MKKEILENKKRNDKSSRNVNSFQRERDRAKKSLKHVKYIHHLFYLKTSLKKKANFYC